MTTRAGLASLVTLALASCGGTTAHPPTTPSVATVSGHVMAGPTCPVERLNHPCPPKPVIATIRATLASRLVASTTSAADGSYRFTLATGVYTLNAATPSGLPRCDPKQVKVAAPVSLEANISCDTGIR
jgi:hypothetical protein